VEFSSGPAVQSGQHLQVTSEGTSFSGSMNMVLCDFSYAAP